VLALPNSQRHEMDAEFWEIFELSEARTKALAEVTPQFGAI
jgi:hypothetical protein